MALQVPLGATFEMQFTKQDAVPTQSGLPVEEVPPSSLPKTMQLATTGSEPLT